MLSRLRKFLLIQVVLASMLFTPLIQSQTALASSFLNVVAADTVAGESTVLKASNLIPGELINFVVKKPDGLIVTVPASVNDNGIASVDLYDYHTRVAGNYAVGAYKVGSSASNFNFNSSFKVYPGDTDASKSLVFMDRAIVKSDLKDAAKLSVILKDKFNNFVYGRSVKLFSSRNEDDFMPNSKITDSLGRADFNVLSSSEGVSYISVLDTTNDITLNQKVQISFVNASNYLASAGGSLIKSAFAADVGPLSGFDLADFPASIAPNQNITFKVKAIDASNQVVQDYAGTIRFSAEGENSSGVTLPANYKFLAEDLGQHQFNLGLSFTQAGTYKIVVNDLNDKFKKGEKTVIVGEAAGAGAGTGSVSNAEKPVISVPAAGSYSQKEQTISGKAQANSNIKVYDNTKEIGATVAGTLGKFSYQASALEDGKHSIYVVSYDPITNEVISTSDPVEITIDTTPPKVEDLQLDPATGIKGGSVINVKVYSEPKLSQAVLIFNSDIVPLTASIDDPSIYVGTIQAPAEPGAYGLNVLVADELQTEKTYENLATVNVDPAGGKIETTLPEKTGANATPTEPNKPAETQVPVDNVKPAAATAPTQVSGLIAYGSNKKVTLVWYAATGEKSIKYYKIYYGEDVRNLAQNVITKDASTTWYIPNLENGKEYFFAVSAIDSDGIESENRSEVVSGIPFMLEINNALTEAPKAPLIQEGLKSAAYSGPFPETTAANGPEILWLILPSLGLAKLTKKSKNKS